MIEHVVTILVAIVGSAGFIRLLDIFVYRREERRSKVASAQEQERSVDLLFLQGAGLQQSHYQSALDRSAAEIARLSDRVVQMERREEENEKERREDEKERRKDAEEIAELRLMVYNFQLALTDIMFGIQALSSQLRDAGIEPVWKPMIKVDELINRSEKIHATKELKE